MLVPDWKKAYTWFSMQAMGASLTLTAAWMAVPTDLKDRVPDGVASTVLMVLLVLGVVGRLVNQKKEGE